MSHATSHGTRLSPIGEGREVDRGEWYGSRHIPTYERVVKLQSRHHTQLTYTRGGAVTGLTKHGAHATGATRDGAREAVHSGRAEARWASVTARMEADNRALQRKAQRLAREGAERRAARRSLCDARPLVLVLFAGDGEAESTLPGELRVLGHRVEAIDTKTGGTSHDVLRPEVAARILAGLRSRRYAAVFIATPCCSYSVGHKPQLRSRKAPTGLASVPANWRRYLTKHNLLAEFTALVIATCVRVGVEWMLENPPDRGDKASPAFWRRFRDHAPLWLQPSIRDALLLAGAELFTFAQCNFGSPFQKYTSIAVSTGTAEQARAAFEPAARCTHAGEEHAEVAYGKDVRGESKAARSAAYPRALNVALAHLLVYMAGSGTTLEVVEDPQPDNDSESDDDSEGAAETQAGVGEVSASFWSGGAAGSEAVTGRVAHGAALDPRIREAVEEARARPPRFASHRWLVAASARELREAAFPGDLYDPVVPTKPTKARKARGAELPAPRPTPRGVVADAACEAPRPAGEITVEMLYLPGVYAEIQAWLARADAAAAALVRRQAGEDGEVPAVPTLVFTQEHMPRWARGVVWDCSTPADCRPVQRSTRHTVFKGEKQLNREALREVAQVLDWQDLDLLNQIGEGGIETRSQCELVTVLAFHHAGLVAEVAQAQKVVEAHLQEEWVSDGTRHLPYAPCRVLPRNVVLQARLRVVDDGDGGWKVEEYLKPRVTTNLSHGDEQAVNAGVPQGERAVLLPTMRAFGRAAAICDEAATFLGHREADTGGYVVDAESAFSYCPIQQADLWTQAFCWWDSEGVAGFYVDRRMGFGGAFAPNRFQRVSTFVAAYVQHLQGLFDAEQPQPEGVQEWRVYRRQLMAEGRLVGTRAQCEARYLQVYIDDFGGVSSCDAVQEPAGLWPLHTRVPDSVPSSCAEVVIGPEHTRAAGGVPAAAESRVMYHAKLAVIGLARLGLRAAPPKVHVGNPLTLLGLRADFKERRISCPESKQKTIAADVCEQRRWARDDKRVDCRRARSLVGRLSNLSQIFPEVLTVLHGGHRVAQPSWRRKGVVHRPRRVKLRRGSRAQTDFVGMLDVGGEVLQHNAGIPLASRAHFAGDSEAGGMSCTTDASGHDGVGGYAFLADRPGEVWVVSEEWPVDVKEALQRAKDTRAQRVREGRLGERELSMPAAELYGKVAVAAAVIRAAGLAISHVIAIGDCDAAEMAVNAGTSGTAQMRVLLAEARVQAGQWLGVKVPRDWNVDADNLSHPTRVERVISSGEAAGLVVHRVRLTDDTEWSVLRRAIAASAAVAAVNAHDTDDSDSDHVRAPRPSDTRKRGRCAW